MYLPPSAALRWTKSCPYLPLPPVALASRLARRKPLPPKGDLAHPTSSPAPQFEPKGVVCVRASSIPDRKLVHIFPDTQTSLDRFSSPRQIHRLTLPRSEVQPHLHSCCNPRR